MAPEMSAIVPLYCPTCGYNLTGLPENRCPECGTRFDPRILRSEQQARATAALGTPEIMVRLLVPPSFFLLMTWLTVQLNVYIIPYILIMPCVIFGVMVAK